MQEPVYTTLSAAAFNALFSEYKEKFVMIALSLVHDLAIAEDLVTDSFLYLWEHRERLQLESSPAAYVLGIVKNKCLMNLRSQQIEKRAQQKIYNMAQWEIQQNIAMLEDCDLARDLFSKEVSEIFHAQLKAMPELTRQIYSSSRFEAKTYQEIAQEHDIPVRKVTYEIQRALELLRYSLKDYLPTLVLLSEFIRK